MRCRLLLWVLVLACSTPLPRPIAPSSVGPVEGAEVDVGSLAVLNASISLDVLIPAEGDLTAALTSARAAALSSGLTIGDAASSPLEKLSTTIQLVSFADEGWNHHLPGYVVSLLDTTEFEQVDRSAGIVRIDARTQAARGWELIRLVTEVARHVAAEQRGWIFDPYRAQLHDADTLASSVPDLGSTDVRTMMRIMGVVNTKGGPDHVRTIGLWRLGLPELLLPEVPHRYLHDAVNLVRATAQTLVQNGGVTRRGTIVVDLSKLPASWPKPDAGTGRFLWTARWMRGPIHHDAMQIVLASGDPKAFVVALQAYAGLDSQ